MRVLILRHGYYPADPRVRREVSALVERGHAVDLVCLRDEGQAARERVAGADVTRLPVRHRRRGPLRYLWEYGAFGVGAAAVTTWRARRRIYDLVQVNTMPDALVFAAIAQRLRGVPVLLDLHELMPELYASKFGVSMDHPLPRFLAGVERWAVRFADACLAVSEPCLERYVDRGSDPEKFTVVMNTADPGLFARPVGASSPVQHGSAAVGDSRSSLRGGPAMGRIVSHGTLVHRYGFDIIIEALSGLPGVELDIVGDGEERSALQRLARRLGVADRVNFSGRIALSEVPALLSQADIGVVANRSDQFTDLVVPTKLMEYVALGVPAVVARTPAVEAYFDDRAVAFFTPGDVQDLRRRMAELLACPRCRRDMVAHADATFGARYAGGASADAYIGVVERLGSARGDLSRTQG